MARSCNILCLMAILCLLAAGITGCHRAPAAGNTALSGPSADRQTKPPAKKLRILHIMSYHSPWEWTDSQYAGFKEALAGLDIEYAVFQMDAKNNSDEAWKQAAGRKARELIDSWRPDLVYASDDEAQEYVVRHYQGAAIPFVFSGVNQSPAGYASDRAGNITGVLEAEHFVQSAKLFKTIVPQARKIAVVFDDSPNWQPIIKRMKEQAGQLPELDFIAWDTISTFAEYKQKILQYQGQVDGICLVGVFNFKDAAGANVPHHDVLRWTAENSRLPDFSFWVDRMAYGTLCGVSVSGYQQGLAAGKIARGILVDGRPPASFPIEATAKGQPAVNLARAKSLGLKIDSKTLLSVKVYPNYAWEN